MMSDKCKPKVNCEALKECNASLADVTADYIRQKGRIRTLEQQIELLKCCGNCKYKKGS